LRNTHTDRHRGAARRLPTVPLDETDPGCRPDQTAAFDAREVLTAAAAAPKHDRDAVVAVDIEGLSCKQAARHLRTPVATIATRVVRGRQHVARALSQSATWMGESAGAGPGDA
jgi:RNA polymerase sigma-70 factor, ECF subfamily